MTDRLVGHGCILNHVGLISPSCSDESAPNLIQVLADTDAAVVMKIGQNLNKIRRALVTAGRADGAYIVEYATMPRQSVCRLKDYSAEWAPYFSIIILHGKGRTP